MGLGGRELRGPPLDPGALLFKPAFVALHHRQHELLAVDQPIAVHVQLLVLLLEQRLHKDRLWVYLMHELLRELADFSLVQEAALVLVDFIKEGICLLDQLQTIHSLNIM